MATISGMCNPNGVYFINSPVIVTVSNLGFPEHTPFHIVRLYVGPDGEYGVFKGDTGGASQIQFDISSALRGQAQYIEDYDECIEDAEDAAGGSTPSTSTNSMLSYTLQAETEYISDDGILVTTRSPAVSGGNAVRGGSTEMERRYGGVSPDTSSLIGSTPSTKPSSAERVGQYSITSTLAWNGGYAEQTYHPASHTPASVVRDEYHDYVDFLFVNRRGACETCSGMMLESESVEVNVTTYAKVETPTFTPSRSLMGIAKGPRRSWSMSSGHQTREWAEWWADEFLMASQWWVRYPVGNPAATRFVPCIVTPAKKSTTIYDRSKQEMPSVDFTVTLALEG